MKRIIINADKLFTGNEIIERASVVVNGTRIVKVGKYGEFKGKGLKTRFLSPGLIDMHVHATPFLYKYPYSRELKVIRYIMSLFLYNGVTTIRETGNSVNNTFNTIQLQMDKPSIHSSLFLDGKDPLWSMSFCVYDKSVIDKMLDLAKVLEVEWIKSYESINPEIFLNIVNEAHKRHFKVASHGRAHVINSKVDTIEHIVTLLRKTKNIKWRKLYLLWSNSQELSQMKAVASHMVRNKIALCPTLVLSKMELFPSDGLTYSKYLRKLDPEYRPYQLKHPRNPLAKIKIKKRKRILKNMLAATKLLHDNGVRILAGSDCGNPFVAHGYSLHEELKLLESTGISRLDVLKSATSECADTLGDMRVGRIKTGCRADLLMIDGDPSRTISDLNKITHIILNGKVINRASIRYMKNP